MELNVLNEQGQESAKLAASDTVFGREYNEALVHQLVVAYQANARQGTRAQLNRRDVHHTTKKPWRQKGTGRARSGMSSSPLWRGGGRTFPNTPDENFTQKINKKAYRAAKLKALGAVEHVMVITAEVSDNLYLASRNLKNVLVVEPRYADPLSLIYYKKIVVTKDAVAKIEEMLG